MKTTSASTAPKHSGGATEKSSSERKSDPANKLSIKSKMGEVQQGTSHKGDEHTNHAFSAPSPKSSASAQAVSRDVLSSPKGAHSAPKRVAVMEKSDVGKISIDKSSSALKTADKPGSKDKAYAGKSEKAGKGAASEISAKSEKYRMSNHGTGHTRPGASTTTTIGSSTTSTTTTTSTSLTSSGSMAQPAATRRDSHSSSAEEPIYENVLSSKSRATDRSNSPTIRAGVREKKHRTTKEKSPPVAHASTHGKTSMKQLRSERRPSLTSSSEEEKEITYENVVAGVIQHVGKPVSPPRSTHTRDKSRHTSAKEKSPPSTHAVTREKTGNAQQADSGRRSPLLAKGTGSPSYAAEIDPDTLPAHASSSSLLVTAFDDPRYKSLVPGNTASGTAKPPTAAIGSPQTSGNRPEKAREKRYDTPASVLPGTTKSTAVSTAALTAAKASTSTSSTSRVTGTRRASADDGSSSSSMSEAVRQSKPVLSKSRSSPARMAPSAPASRPAVLGDDVSDELLTMTGSFDDVAQQLEDDDLGSSSSDDIFKEYIPTPPRPPCKYYGEGQEARDWKDIRTYVEKTATAYVMRPSLLTDELQQGSFMDNLYRNRIIQEAEVKEDNRWLQASPLQKTQDAFFAAIHASDTPGLERAIKRLREQVATMFHTIVHSERESLFEEFRITNNAEFTKAMLVRLLQNVVTATAREQPIETFRWVAQHLLAEFASEHLPPITAGVIATYFVAGDHKRVDAILDYQWRVDKANDPWRLDSLPVTFFDAEGGKFIEVPPEEAAGLSKKQLRILQRERSRESPPFRALWGRMKDVPASIMRECKPGGDKLVTVWAARTVRSLVCGARQREQMIGRQQTENYIRLACQHDSAHTIHEILCPRFGPEIGMWGTPGAFLRYPDERRYDDRLKRFRDLDAFHLPEILRQSKEICAFIEAEAIRFQAHRILGYLKHWPEILLEDDLLQIKLEATLLGPGKDDIPFPPVSN